MPSNCAHLTDTDERDSIVKNFCEITKRIIYKSDQKIKRVLSKCRKCKRLASPTMSLCLSCVTVGCIEHLQDHFETSGHKFAVSMEFGHIFCATCKDFVYDRKTEKIRREAENNFRKRLGLCLKNEWNPSSSESKILQTGSQMFYLDRGTIRGLRGLVNLGNTCFMNCIIQSLIHIPHLRDYFLTDQHICRYQLNGNNSDPSNLCLMCELANIFQEFYSGQSDPFVPQRMLHLVWKHAEHLAGYEQHDAHEFLISALNVLHKHSESNSIKSNPNECRCIIDRLFTGRLQSDLTCMRCGRVSTTVDPFWDISLELVSNSGGQYIERTLEDCLANYVKCETLELPVIKCDRCGTYVTATKQLSLKTLPMIACFHLKRFEHTVFNKRKKIHSVVRFPEQIDLTPYTTAYCKKLKLNGTACKEDSAVDLLNRSSNKYELISVVNHHGSTESGHYSCFIRHYMEQWYRCNDQHIANEVLESVLASEGYLLFYVKSFIDYD